MRYAVVLLAAAIMGCPEEDQPTESPAPGESPPVVSMNLLNGNEVLDTTVIAVTATDDKGVIQVEIFIDNVVIASFLHPPYSYVWDASGFPDSSVFLLYAKAHDADGNVSSSQVVTATTFHLQPTGLTVDTTFENHVTLSWIDNSQKEGGFEIEHRINAGDYMSAGFAVQNATTATVTGSFSPGDVLTFRVRAFSGETRSRWSNTATAYWIPPGTKGSGVYVLNEGNFGDPTGARLSFFDFLTDSVQFDVYEGANGGAHLGSTGADMVLIDEKIYVLMSGSENLVVMSSENNTMLQTATLAGSAPHSLVIDELRGKVYVTQLFAGSVLVLDLTTLAIELTVPTGLNPQGMIIVGDILFVCNSGYGADKTVTAISTVTNTVVMNIPVGDGPTDVVLGADGNLWVACTGNAFGSPPSFGSVFVVNPLSLMVLDSLIFPENLWGDIVTGNDGTLYLLGVTSGSFYGGPVHRILPSSRAIDLNYIPGTSYSLSADIVSGRLYAADANDFQSDGEVNIHEPDGTLVKSFPTQIGPGVMAFSP